MNILHRGIKYRQVVFVDVVHPDKTQAVRAASQVGKIVGADFEKDLITVEMTVPAAWVRENPNS